MPTYDYECRSCRNRIEIIHPMREDGPTTCELCGGVLRRILYPAGIIFKGSGFYSTDSRNSQSDASAARSDKDGDSSKGGATGDGASGAAPAEGGGNSSDGGSSKNGGRSSTEGGTVSRGPATRGEGGSERTDRKGSTDSGAA